MLNKNDIGLKVTFLKLTSDTNRSFGTYITKNNRVARNKKTNSKHHQTKVLTLVFCMLIFITQKQTHSTYHAC